MDVSTTQVRATGPDGQAADNTEQLRSVMPRTSVERASRWWLAGAFVLAYAGFVADSFGKQVFDTKIDLTIDPYTFFHSLVYLWNPNGWFGYLQDQYQGYVFPTAPFFIVGHVLAIPAWLVQRAWMATVVAVAFWGIVRLAEELKIGSLGSRLAAGAAFALLPTFTALNGSVTDLAAPGALIAWATIPLVRASRGGSTIRGAALSAVAVLFMGGANGAVTIYALIVPALYLLTRAPSPRKRSLIGWWVVCVALATAWWAIPLLFLGKYGFNFLPFIEQSATTSSTSSATTALSGSSIWTAYVSLGVGGWNQAGLTLTTGPIMIIAAGLTAAAGLCGLASKEIRERRFLVVSLAVASVIAMATYWGPLGGPFSRILLPILNGPLAPFRSVYKLEPAIALPLALGIAYSLHRVVQWRPRRVARTTWRIAAGFAAVAVLASLAGPYFMGRATNNYAFAGIPSYWYKVADFLAKESPRNTALVLPATTHAQYVWGWSVDQPLEALARSPWSADMDVPYGGAGSTRMVDAIELALRTGTPSPGLPALLRRSGIKYIVVTNDMEYQLSDSPSPYQVHQVLESSGLEPVAHFGPTIQTTSTDSPTLTLDSKGIHVPYPSVEIFQATPSAGGSGTSSPVATYPVSSAALVSGGPEAIKQLLDGGVLGGRQAAILAGNWHGAYRGNLLAVTDTLRRANEANGLVNDFASYTYTATEKTPGQTRVPDSVVSPNQLLPFKGLQHQTVAVLSGAKSITSSSAGSTFFSLPEYNPANVFDGLSNSGWIAANPYGSVGEWIQITFDHPLDPRGARIQFAEGPGHAVVTSVRVTTNGGSTVTQVKPTSQPQALNVPAGKADYLRVTITSLKGGTSDRAGIRAISIPGVHVRMTLKPPQETPETGAKRLAFSFAATPTDNLDLLRMPAEPIMARQFSTPRQMSVNVTGRALPRPSPALDTLIGSSALTITASSSFGSLPSFRPQNLIDGDLTTSWVAASPKASIHMQWPHAVTLSSLTLVDTSIPFAAPPEEVLISSPAGRRLVHVVGNSNFAALSFAPLTTNQVTVSFPKVQTQLIDNGLNQTVQAPVGLAELDFQALIPYRTRVPDPAATVSVPCGFGPPIYIDGKKYETSMNPRISDLLAGNPVNFTVCAPSSSSSGAQTLSGGSHSLITPQTTIPFNVSAVTIDEVNTASPSRQPAARQSRVVSWGQESRDVALGAGPATYLEVHQNYNVGWTATLNGQTLTPIVLDGWQQGYVVPAGRGGTVHMTFAPERTYLLGLAVGVFGLILLMLFAFGVLGKRRGVDLDPSPPWDSRVRLWVSEGLAAGIVFVVGGPLVLVVPVLAFIRSRRPRWLPSIAFFGMAAAGVIAAINPGTGAISRSGAFSAPAQACAVVALAAVLVALAQSLSEGGSKREPSGTTGKPGSAVVSVEGDATESVPGPARNGAGAS
jgi:arabinofuranan 3-O-arabinosyltransferase